MGALASARQGRAASPSPRPPVRQHLVTPSGSQFVRARERKTRAPGHHGNCIRALSLSLLLHPPLCFRGDQAPFDGKVLLASPYLASLSSQTHYVAFTSERRGFYNTHVCCVCVCVYMEVL